MTCLDVTSDLCEVEVRRMHKGKERKGKERKGKESFECRLQLDEAWLGRANRINALPPCAITALFASCVNCSAICQGKFCCVEVAMALPKYELGRWVHLLQQKRP